MNKKIVLIIVLISLIFFSIIFKKYKTDFDDFETLYLLQIGAYKNYDNVAKNTRDLENYIVHEEDDLYKIFVGASLSEEVIETLIHTYQINNSYKKELKLKDYELINKLEKYDKIIKSVENKEALDKVIKEELKILEKYLSSSSF